MGFEGLFLALASSVLGGALSLVGVTAAAAGVEGVGAALGVLSSAGRHVGVTRAAADVELVLALVVGGGKSDSGEGHGEKCGDADHFGGGVEGV